MKKFDLKVYFSGGKKTDFNEKIKISDNLKDLEKKGLTIYK